MAAINKATQGPLPNMARKSDRTFVSVWTGATRSLVVANVIQNKMTDSTAKMIIVS